MDTNTKTYQPDPRFIAAQKAIAAKLGVTPEDVSIRVGGNNDAIGDIGYRADGMGSSPDGSVTNLVIRVHKPGLDLERPRLTNNIRASLAELKPLADTAQMVPQDTLVVKLLEEIKTATAGTNFNQKLLEWPGFKPEVVSNGWEIGDYAAQNVRDNAYGVTMNLHFAHEKGANQAAAIERFAELTKGRLEGIKEILTERVVKYTKLNMTERGLNAQETDAVKKQAEAEGKNADEALKQALTDKVAQAEVKVREDMAKLEISVNIDHNNLKVILRSPEQAEAYKKAVAAGNEHAKPDNSDDLRATNPLTSRVVGLTTEETPATGTMAAHQPQLHKALARSFLFDKEKNIAPDALQIFGRRDMQIALIKELKLRVLPAHPEKQVELEKIVYSELFMNHGSWHNEPGQAGVAKPEPLFSKPKDTNDTLEISFALKQDSDPAKNQVLQVVEGLAGNTAGQQSTPSIPPAATTPIGALEAAANAITAAADRLISWVQRVEAKQNQPAPTVNSSDQVIASEIIANAGATASSWTDRTVKPTDGQQLKVGG